MVEVKNVEVFGLNRAINAINNSFNVGEINTTAEPDEKRWKVARALGKDMNAHQSHDAYLAGCNVQFILKCDQSFFEKIAKNKFFIFSRLKNKELFVSTNFRALKCFILKHPEETAFKAIICNEVENFSNLTGIQLNI